MMPEAMTSNITSSPEVRSGPEGLQFLCAKYSSLISRLGAEVTARQQAEAEARMLDLKLQEESKHWEAERKALQNELLAIQSRRPELLSTSAIPTTSSSCDIGSARANQAALERLRNENADLRAQGVERREELATCKEHLAKWRSKAAEMEREAAKAARNLEEAEGRHRYVQEEMRQALRAASLAKAREQQAALSAGRGSRELQAREERLLALRVEGQRQAKRANSAERRLDLAAKGTEMEKAKLQQQLQEMQLHLGAALESAQNASKETARAEQGEAIARQDCADMKGQLRAAEALQMAQASRCGDLIGELQALRQRLDGMEVARSGSATQLASGLHLELQTTRAALSEQEMNGQRLHEELHESKRRLERGSTLQAAEWRRRLASCEEAVARSRAQVAEERKCRERCHLEALRAGEKLRVSRAQTATLREKLRAFEETELRYTTRSTRGFVAATPRETGETAQFRPQRAASVGAIRPTEPSPRTEPRPQMMSSSQCDVASRPSSMDVGWRVQEPQTLEAMLPPHASSGDRDVEFIGRGRGPQGNLWQVAPDGSDMHSVQQFIAEEERRLFTEAGTTFACDGARLSWSEEPRQELRPSPAVNLAKCQGQGTFGQAEPLGLAADTDEVDISVLLAAEPRVLKLPEPLQLGQAAMADIRRAGA